MRIAIRLGLFLICLCLLYPTVVLGLYFFTSRANTEASKVDTLIVLGCPTNPDGSPSVEQRERVMEGVREFKKGVSNHIIMSGAAAHNTFVEARAMASLAEANGVPADALVEEGQAKDTIQNIYYADKIMERNGWRTTEVISSPYHLPRTALILGRYPQVQWELHAARWPAGYGILDKFRLDWREALTCFRIRMHGFRDSKYLPSLPG